MYVVVENVCCFVVVLFILVCHIQRHAQYPPTLWGVEMLNIIDFIMLWGKSSNFAFRLTQKVIGGKRIVGYYRRMKTAIILFGTASR